MGEAVSVGPHLYHGTGIYALAAIAQSDSLIEGTYWGKPNEPHGPRLTRSYAMAKEFIRYNVHWGEGGVIVFDRAALERDFTLQSYVDKLYDGSSMGRDEQEVAVITPVIKDLHKYILCIHCNPEVIRLALHPDNVEAAQNDSGWAFRSESTWEAERALAVLSRHDKLNKWMPEDGYPMLGNYFCEDSVRQPHIQRSSL